MYSRMLDKQLEEWLAEDVGSGDLTSEALLPEGAVTAGIIHAKDTGILCGVEVARQVFRVLDPSLTFEALAKDGDKLEPGTLIAKVTGSARSVLTGERLALNLLQHLSGIATRTKKLADLAKPYGTRVVDTRKTTPGLRLLEKYAVRTGGGHNHRLGLYDAILIKDNHIAVAGGVKEALARAKAYASHMTRIEIEVESLAQAKEALEGRRRDHAGQHGSGGHEGMCKDDRSPGGGGSLRGHRRAQSGSRSSRRGGRNQHRSPDPQRKSPGHQSGCGGD